MKLLAVCVLAALAVRDVESTMSEAQVKSTTQMLRKVCQPKLKISNDQLAGFKDGNFPQDNDVMCYMECILRTGQMMKEGTINWEALKKQLANLPPSYSEYAIGAADTCQSKVNNPDKCEQAYQFYTCFYEQNPEKFFLP